MRPLFECQYNHFVGQKLTVLYVFICNDKKTRKILVKLDKSGKN